ncbi:hypothetical protein LWC34_22645 [Kibdelosporangium philippinense]|uniref:DUF5666 domain-containing protein n=1 Tax=Kibdelosporangium philippinense TaxID=211113 RepID=A0ABS8ZCL3_9PSEU|nr:hypothetical protein [Kibdelosporangium philippinense]MCE7005603.1 hypothetical protein [Kibdelosporangium philippinense]
MTEPQQTPAPLPGDLDQELSQAKRGLSKVTIGLGVVVLALVAFFGGVWTHSAVAGSSTAAAAQPQRPGGGGGMRIGPGGGGQGQGGGQFRGGTMGTVDRIEGNAIYVKLPDGTETKVTTSDTTKVETTVEGKLSDITPGSSVLVQGQRAEDGVTANTITKRPS